MTDYYDEYYESELEKFKFLDYIIDKLKNDDSEKNFLFNQSLFLLEQEEIAQENIEEFVDSGYESV